MISIAQPVIGDEEVKAVNEVLSSGMIAQGPRVAQLEEDFAKFCGTKYAVAVNSGTAAIHCALYAAGVKADDEVITTPFSFIATVNPIMFLGAKPVFVDVDVDSFNIDSNKIEAAVTDKTTAIVPVHLYGQPVDFDELNRVADEHKLKVIEDACQAVGAEYKGAKAGALGDAGCFSLYATKNIMSGEGGLVSTNDADMVSAMKQFRQHGMTAQYEYEDIGLNYRMSDLHAAIAIEQLKKVNEFNQKRQQNAKLLDELLKDVQGIQTPKRLANRSHVYHQYTIKLGEEAGISREDFVTKLKDSGVGAGVYYPQPMHFYKHIQALGYKQGEFPNAEKVAAQVVSLPIHQSLSEQDIRTIADAVKKAVQ